MGAQNQCLGSHIWNFQLKCRWVLLEKCPIILLEREREKERKRERKKERKNLFIAFLNVFNAGGGGEGNRDGAVARALASQQCVPIRRHMWVEFVVGSLPCSDKLFSGFSGFPLCSKTSISKFQFDLDYCQALNHEPLARVMAQAVPVFDIKFTITFFLQMCIST